METRDAYIRNVGLGKFSVVDLRRSRVGLGYVKKGAEFQNKLSLTIPVPFKDIKRDHGNVS